MTSTDRLAKVLNAGLAHRDCDTGVSFFGNSTKKKEAKANFNDTMSGLIVLEEIFETMSNEGSEISSEDKNAYLEHIRRFFTIADAMRKEHSGTWNDNGHKLMVQSIKTQRALDAVPVRDRD
jgi:hypothetical protein